MKIRVRIYRCVARMMLISSLISASLTYTVAQYFSEDDIQELIRKAGRRNRRSGRKSQLNLWDGLNLMDE